MTTNISFMRWLGEKTASEKQASTALIRAMRRGKLSPETIRRAASGMQPGKFRFVKPLGRGQFSMADHVVGNIGGVGDEMVRKLPTRVSTPQEQYGGYAKVTDYLNNRFAKGQTPIIAPYREVGPKGAFQAMATGKVTQPDEIQEMLSDLHGGNIGPGGQIFDFMVPNVSDPDFRKFLIQNRIDDPPWRRLLRPGPDQWPHSSNDYLGNLNSRAPNRWLNHRNQSNDQLRRFWSKPDAVNEVAVMTASNTAARPSVPRIHSDPFHGQSTGFGSPSQSPSPLPPRLTKLEPFSVRYPRSTERRFTRPESVPSAQSLPLSQLNSAMPYKPNLGDRLQTAAELAGLAGASGAAGYGVYRSLTK